ncbi:MAG: DNA mismatch repair endonuclease MutL [Bacteroidaceae bacterium]|nr:DNA mismatch repair endonuclease MutL [Bacteroidaceae bacterium]
MSDIIHLLPDSVANQIAAGEVIQRPASVIKELVENAVDAGATSVQIILKDAGRTLIQVIDNGCGMSPTDARLAFERHSTSKIRQAEDLFSLRTMGFRGEALASIAAIAQVELRTRRAEDEVGTCLRMAASQCESQEVITAPVGSNFSIKNIFFNVPARRKFLKSNQVELSNIINEFERMALVNTEVEFVLIHNDSELHRLPAGSLRQRIVSLFGKSLNQQLLPVEAHTSIVNLSGYVGKPEAARKRGALQYLFVNGRYMRHAGFHKAVMKAYEELIPQNEMPNYFLNFTVSPDTIDVNIHPTKTEIKFENEQAIWPIVMAAVKEALGKFCAAPSIDFDMEDAPDIPAYTPGTPIATPSKGYNPSYNPFNQPARSGSNAKRPDYDWQKLYEGFTSSHNDTPLPGDTDCRADDFLASSIVPTTPIASCDDSEYVQSSLNIETKTTHAPSLYMQFKGRYIVTPSKNGLLLVDQHRAHVRVLFEQYMQRRATEQSIPSQQILYPQLIQLSPSQVALFEEVELALSQLGFDLSDMGGGTYSVCGIPAGIEGLDINTLIEQMFLAAESNEANLADDLFARIALSLAQSAAIPVGQVLTPCEMEQLIGDLFALATPNYTPDGKPVFTLFTNDEICKRM